MKQCVVGANRQGRVGNTPGKMSQIYNKFNHKVIMGVRFAKMVRSSTKYVTKRSYNIRWWDVYQTTDVSEAVPTFY